MNGTKSGPRVGVVLCISVFALVACGSTSGSNSSPASSDPSLESASPASVPEAGSDPLAGIWRSDQITAADVDDYMRRKFSGSALDQWERVSSCYPKAGQTVVQMLHFAGDQLVITTSKDGGTAHEGWTGTYAIQDASTYFAGGETGPLYITVDYKIKDGRLYTDLIKDDFPDHSPWTVANDGPGAASLTIGKPLADTMCQVEIYEMTPFTRVG